MQSVRAGWSHSLRNPLHTPFSRGCVEQFSKHLTQPDIHTPDTTHLVQWLVSSAGRWGRNHSLILSLGLFFSFLPQPFLPPLHPPPPLWQQTTYVTSRIDPFMGAHKRWTKGGFKRHKSNELHFSVRESLCVSFYRGVPSWSHQACSVKHIWFVMCFCCIYILLFDLSALYFTLLLQWPTLPRYAFK